MTSTFVNRRTASIVTVALALGIAAPAGAMPFQQNQQGSYVPARSLQTQAPTGAEATSHSPGGGISEWGYVAIGSGAASLALVGVGGTRVASRRRQQRLTAHQPTIAA